MAKFKKAQEFCEKAFTWDPLFTWFDKTGVCTLDADRRVRLDLCTNGTHGQWEGFELTILSKTRGNLTSKRFWFQEYLDGWVTVGNVSKPVVLEHCGWGWYGAFNDSLDTKPYVAAVETFIKAFE
jgi:hypothetical protein